MKLATWNVNSVNARIETVLDWVKDALPDVCAFQEIKCIDEKFPTEAFESLGYNVAVHGQKTYNGVALISKYPLEDVRRGLPGNDADEQARYIEAVIGAPKPVRMCGLYLPNGNPIGTEKFAYKLGWMARLKAHAKGLCWPTRKPSSWRAISTSSPSPKTPTDPKDGSATPLFQPESRAAWRGFINLGLTDAHAAVGAEPHAYTFWDYQAGAWQRDHGIRIDHMLLSPEAADRLTASEVHRDCRAMEKPSDHVPLDGQAGLR